MDLRQLGYVVAVADHGGFTKAADALHVAQPSLSQAVRALEAELGVELFVRHPRSVQLTAAGEALLPPARQALRDAATARAAVAQVAGVQAGHLDLVCLPTLAADPVAGFIGRFRRAHPDVTVRLVEPEAADAVAELVREGSSEIGFAELPHAAGGLIAHPLEAQDYVALVPRARDRARGGKPRLTIRELAREPIVTTPRGTSTRRQLDEAFAAAGLTFQVAVETDHREAIGPLVAAGAGTAVLPRGVADAARHVDTVVRELSPPLRRQIGILHRPGAQSPAAARFLELVVGPAGPAGRARPAPRRRGG